MAFKSEYIGWQCFQVYSNLCLNLLGMSGKDEKLRLTNLEWGVDFLRLTNLVKTSLDGQI